MVSKAQVAAALVLIVVACGPKPPAAGPEALEPVSREVALLSLPSVDGEEVDFVRWRGKPVVVHFAHTGSLDAQADIEELRATRERVPELILVEIVVDESAARLAPHWADASRIDWSVLLPHPGLLDGGTAFGRVRVVPTTFLLDPEGRVSWRWEGALPRRAIDRALVEVRRDD